MGSSTGLEEQHPILHTKKGLADNAMGEFGPPTDKALGSCWVQLDINNIV